MRARKAHSTGALVKACCILNRRRMDGEHDSRTNMGGAGTRCLERMRIMLCMNVAISKSMYDWIHSGHHTVDIMAEMFYMMSHYDCWCVDDVADQQYDRYFAGTGALQPFGMLMEGHIHYHVYMDDVHQALADRSEWYETYQQEMVLLARHVREWYHVVKQHGIDHVFTIGGSWGALCLTQAIVEIRWAIK